MVRWLPLWLALPGMAEAAGAGEVTVGAHADRADPPRGESAWALGGWGSVGLSDAFALVASAATADHPLPRSDPSQPASLTVTSLAMGLRYDLDILSVAPFLGVQLGALWQVPEGQDRQLDAQTLVSVGVDWVFWRHASLGIAAHWHQPFPEGTGYFRAGPRVALRWP